MDQFFAKDFTGGAFVFLGAAHTTALIIIALINLTFIQLRQVDSPDLRKTLRNTMAAVLIANEAAWHVWNWSVGNWTIQTMLPLHLCSVMVFLSAYMLVTRSDAIYEPLYFLGIGAAIQAIFTPDLGLYGFPHFRFFQTFISHGLIVTAAIYMTVVEGYRPTLKSFRNVIVGANIYMLFVGVINWLIGSNYLFIAHKPETPSLIDVLGPWPWYILGLEAVGLLTCAILYIPFAILDWRNSRVRAQIS
ncbi:MAG: TIGR02206 family membrane protein [Chloroflexi bacterium]|nr:TIGR02206 family membrane protein [Chloroflexota bacterium]